MTVQELINQLKEYGELYGFDEVVRVYVSAKAETMDFAVQDMHYIHDEYVLDHFIEIEDVDVNGIGTSGIFIRTKEICEEDL